MYAVYDRTNSNSASLVMIVKHRSGSSVSGAIELSVLAMDFT